MSRLTMRLGGLAVAGLVLSWSATAKDLTVGLSAEVSSFDPHFRYNIVDVGHHRNIYDPLVIQDNRQQTTPGLAESWKPLDDTTWEFTLRKGIKFHDGSDFDAEDVIASLERVPLVKTTGGFTFYTSQIADIQAIDSYTIRIKTNTAYPLLPLDLSQVFIISKEAAETVESEPFNSGATAIGTGPFKFSKWIKGDRTVLVRNEDYWGTKPEWDTVTFRIITNDAARVAALLAGDVDIIEKVPPAEVNSLRENPDASVWESTSNRVIYLYIDQRDKTPMVTDNDGNPLPENPLQDVRVREALSKAIDRDVIVEKVMENLALPAGQVLPPGFFGVSKNLKPDAYDPERAKALLAEAGYPNGFRLTMHGPNDRYVNDAKVVQAIAQMFTRVGIRTEVDTMPKNVFFKRASNLDFSVNLQGWGSTGEASSVLRGIIYTHDMESGMGTFNVGRYSNPEVDALVDQSLVTVDDDERAALLARATELAMADYALIPTHYQFAVWATGKGLQYLPRTDEMTIANGVTSVQ